MRCDSSKSIAGQRVPPSALRRRKGARHALQVETRIAGPDVVFEIVQEFLLEVREAANDDRRDDVGEERTGRCLANQCDLLEPEIR